VSALRIVSRRSRFYTAKTGTGHACLLLGPLAVAEEVRCLGIGAALMRLALRRANLLGHRAVILVGDADYYDRFGFSVAITGALRMPGPYERERLLACELVPGALRGAGGLIAPASLPPSRLSGLMDRIAGSQAPIGQPA
ncbi:MAG: GNAT family N-acetyltransferase, partial [Bradyrhizobium sp.]